MNEMSTISSLIAHHEELSRLLPFIKGIAIIEYDGDDIGASTGFYEYLLDNGLSIDVVKRIILCGRKSEKRESNVQTLRALFPSVEPEKTNKKWYDTDFKSLNILNVLVLHMATCIPVGEYDNNRGDGVKLHEIVAITRHAYSVCFLVNYTSFTASRKKGYTCLRANLRLTDFTTEEKNEEIPAPSSFCLERQEYMRTCQETLSPETLFFLCFDEAEHGCEECNQCDKYGKRKQCPYAQRIIAEFYRKGMYVPKDEKIAHQWEAMAARQGYQPAHIQVADDLCEGNGCNQSIQEALDIYKVYARRNDEYCMNRMITLTEDNEEIERMIAIPYIAQLAKRGDENMILKLSDVFQNGDYGLPKDIIQQEEWIRQGAENGNPRFVKAMAEMYESNGNWSDSYNWYKKLAEVCPETVDENKIEEIELKMLTNGSTDEEIAQKGMDYLYGYHGIERDTHLAFRCLNYAKEKEIPLAIGLLGQMYLKGLGIEKDEPTGATLIVEAAKKGDLLSKESIVYHLYGSDYVRMNWGLTPTEETSEIEMFHYLESSFFNAIDDELRQNQDNPIAHYLLGTYSRIEEEAFSEMMTAAELNYPPAQHYLAMMYKEGRGTHPDSSLYREWIERAAKNGYYEAEGVYGVMLYNHWSQKSNAFTYLKNAFDQGYKESEAYWCLAQCYMHGIGTQKNEEKARPMYIRAAENNNPYAQESLCRAYFYGYYSFETNYHEARRWGEEALKNGIKSVRFEIAYSSWRTGYQERSQELYLELANEGNALAMNNYACGLSSREESVLWFQKAADAGNSYGMWNLARYYKDGTAVEKDIEKAIDLYTRASEKGCVGATKDLAYLYQYGNGIECDGEKAVRWLKKAIDQGDNDSLITIANIYLEGRIICQNTETAIHYYKMAAEKGIEKALIQLGNIYENGIGVAENIHKAIFWYRKAAANGNETAKRILKQWGSNWIEDGKIEDGTNDESEKH